MFSELWNNVKARVRKLVGIKTIEQVLKLTPTLSSKMQHALDLWTKMYEGDSPWVHEPTPDNPTRVISLGLPAFIASEKARMVTLEMVSEITAPMEDVEIENPDYQEPVPDAYGNILPPTQPQMIKVSQPVGDTTRAEYMNEQYQKKVINKLRAQLEYGVAKGGLVIKPYYIANTQAEQQLQDGESPENIQRGQIEFDFIQADGFYPIAFDASGKITEAVFLQKKIDKDNIYTRLEHHILNGNSVIVENKAYKANNQSTTANYTIEGELGVEISLSDVPEWAQLQPKTVIKNVDRLLFAYFKMPEANTIDTHSPLGVSVYSRAVNLIKEADKQYSRLLWEFEGGELAIDVDRTALMDEVDLSTGRSLTIRPQMQQRLFRKLDLNSEDTYNVFNPSLRDVSLINGLNNILMRIEDVCGLARGTLADVSAEARTATELKILKQRTYSSVTDIQTKALQPALEDVVYIMNVLCTLYNIVGDSPINPETGIPDTTNIGKYSVSFEWDDSTIVDVESELGKRITLMQNGLASKIETRMWYFGETEAQAREALRKIDEETMQGVYQDLQTEESRSAVANNGVGQK